MCVSVCTFVLVDESVYERCLPAPLAATHNYRHVTRLCSHTHNKHTQTDTGQREKFNAIRMYCIRFGRLSSTLFLQ